MRRLARGDRTGACCFSLAAEPAGRPGSPDPEGSLQVGARASIAASEREVDVMEHLANSHVVEIPWFNERYTRKIALPRIPPIRMGGLETRSLAHQALGLRGARGGTGGRSRLPDVGSIRRAGAGPREAAEGVCRSGGGDHALAAPGIHPAERRPPWGGLRSLSADGLLLHSLLNLLGLLPWGATPPATSR